LVLAEAVVDAGRTEAEMLARNDARPDPDRTGRSRGSEIDGDALSQNASLVEYQKALRWDGKLPQANYASAPSLSRKCGQRPA
jgi:hypothetical protein